MKLKNLGSFTIGVGGMAWAALSLSQEALVILGLIGFAITIFCAGFNWGEHLTLREKKEKQKVERVGDQWRQTHER